MKFPTYEEMAKDVAEKALDEILYDGKSIREWMQIIVSEDAISRDKAIVQLSHLLSDWDDDWNVAIRKCIETVKIVSPITPAEKPNKWIPVSERLPEEYGEYLITWTTSQNERPFIEICECEVTSEYDYEHERFEVEWLLEDYIKAYPNVEVIAWMPLPESYKASPTGEEVEE